MSTTSKHLLWGVAAAALALGVTACEPVGYWGYGGSYLYPGEGGYYASPGVSVYGGPGYYGGYYGHRAYYPYGRQYGGYYGHPYYRRW
jgi:hypothetical protein